MPVDRVFFTVNGIEMSPVIHISEHEQLTQGKTLAWLLAVGVIRATFYFY